MEGFRHITALCGKSHQLLRAAIELLLLFPTNVVMFSPGLQNIEVFLLLTSPSGIGVPQICQESNEIQARKLRLIFRHPPRTRTVCKTTAGSASRSVSTEGLQLSPCGIFPMGFFACDLPRTSQINSKGGI